MAFEDHYFKSYTYGVLTLRHRPTDPRYLPGFAIEHPKEIPGRFCLAKVTYKHGVQVKNCASAQRFSEMKDVVLHELHSSLARLTPDIKKMMTREEVLASMPDTAEIEWKDFSENEKTPLVAAHRECRSMINAITYWNYEEELCTNTMLAVEVVEICVADGMELENINA